MCTQCGSIDLAQGSTVRRVKVPRRRQRVMDGSRADAKPRSRGPPGEGRQTARAPVADEEVHYSHAPVLRGGGADLTQVLVVAYLNPAAVSSACHLVHFHTPREICGFAAGRG